MIQAKTDKVTPPNESCDHMNAEATFDWRVVCCLVLVSAIDLFSNTVYFQEALIIPGHIILSLYS